MLSDVECALIESLAGDVRALAAEVRTLITEVRMVRNEERRHGTAIGDVLKRVEVLEEEVHRSSNPPEAA